MPTTTDRARKCDCPVVYDGSLRSGTPTANAGSVATSKPTRRVVSWIRSTSEGIDHVHSLDRRGHVLGSQPHQCKQGAVPAPITTESFPTPGLLLRTTDPGAQRTVREFARAQAEKATSLHRTLTACLDTAQGTRARVAALTAAFDDAERWRYELAVDSPHGTGPYGSVHTERFRTWITDDNTNYFRIGDHERLRDGAVWDPVARVYVGGIETPASGTMRRIGEMAAARFADTPGVEVIHNSFSLHNGVTVRGTRLLTGAPACHAATELAARIAARGGDVSRIRTDGDLLYTASAREEERARIFASALHLLAEEYATPSDALTAWMRAAYFLYQAPRKKRGSDACIRAFLVATGTAMLGQPPSVLHDIDLQAYVQQPDQFLSALCSIQS